MNSVLIALLVGVVLVEIVEHLILPLWWLIAQRRQKSLCGVDGLLGRAVTVRRWHGSSGRVRLDGTVWRAVCDVPLAVGTRARIVGVEGLTLKVLPCDKPAP